MRAVMLSTIFLAVCSFGLSFIFTPLVREIARRRYWFDHPDNNRKKHAMPIPRIGGVPILLAFVGSLGVLAGFPGTPVDEQSLVWRLLPASVLILALGLFDDLIGLTARQKLLGQTLAAGLACWSGIQIRSLGDGAVASYLGVPLTIVWLVGCANAFNLIDGVDGLASGVGLIATAVMLVVAHLYGDVQLFTAAVPLAGALLAFLIFNWHPATIFLGDSGSLWVGFVLGCLGVIWCQKAETVPAIAAPLVALSIPLLDMGLSIARRFLQKRPIFHGDRNHIHHRLLDRGLSPGRVALVLCLASALAGSFALLQSWTSRETGWVIVSVWCIIVWIGLRELRYSEFGIAARLLRQNNLRSMVKGNLSFLRCEAALKSATSADECWRAIRTVSSECGFSAAALRLGRMIYHELPEQAPDRYVLHIPLSDSDYVQLMFRFPCSAGPMIIGPLADLLREVLSAKGAQFSPVQILPTMVMVAAAGQAPWTRSEHVESVQRL